MYQSIFYMMVNGHAGDGFCDILKMKQEFNDKYNFFFWGHGQSGFIPEKIYDTIHNYETPLLLQYNPNAKNTKSITNEENEPIYFYACKSCDGKIYKLPPKAIIGTSKSKYALVCKNLSKCQETITISDYFLAPGSGFDNKQYNMMDYFNHCSLWSGACGIYKSKINGSQNLELKKNCDRTMVGKPKRKIGSIDYKAVILDTVECLFKDDIPEEYKNQELEMYTLSI